MILAAKRGLAAGVVRTSHLVKQVVQRWWFIRDLRHLNDVLARGDLGGRYWVWGGLLLGWAREGHVLSHDVWDADFAYLSDDSDRFDRAALELFDAGFKPLYRCVNNAGVVTMYSFGRHSAEFDFFPMFDAGESLRFYMHKTPYESPPDFGWLEIEGRIRSQGLVSFRFLRRTWLKHADHEAELEAIYGDWQKENRSWQCMDDGSIVSWEPWENTDLAWRGVHPPQRSDVTSGQEGAQESLFEIEEVIRGEPNPDLLRGWNIDVPRAGMFVDPHDLPLDGWALGRTCKARAIKVSQNNRELSALPRTWWAKLVTRLNWPKGHVPIGSWRPDVGKAFPEIAEAEFSGFRCTVGVLPTASRTEVEVWCVLKTGQRVHLGTVRGLLR